MIKNKAYKYRIYPNKEQELLIAKTIGCSRYVYNSFLALWNETYENTGKGLSYNECSAMLPEMKKEFEWLKEVDSIALQAQARNLADGFTRFFKKQNDKPNFKSKSNPVQSYTTKYTNDNIRVTNTHIRLPKLGMVKYANSRDIKGRIINATIRKNPTGKYYISILTEEEIEELAVNDKAIGIDLGITDFAILSDGTKVERTKFTNELEKKLAREQRKLSRRALNAKKNNIPLSEAKNYQKQRIVVAKIHEKINNRRNDFLNKLSTDIVKSHGTICIEDLNTKGMLRNHKLAKSISDVSWSRFVSMLKYKSDWYGRVIVQVDSWYPSSRLCSVCGHNDGEKQLDIREWICPKCGSRHDRDINASTNILKEGLNLLQIHQENRGDHGDSLVNKSNRC